MNSFHRNNHRPKSVQHLMEKLKGPKGGGTSPLPRLTVDAAFKHVKAGGIIQVIVDGTAEILDEDNKPLGYLTKRSHRVLVKIIDQGLDKLAQ